MSKLGLTKRAKIISKFDSKLDHLDFNSMSNALEESLKRIGVNSLYAMMLHREEFLSLWDKGLSKILRDLVASGKVEHIGVSVYTPDKAIKAMNIEDIDLVQLPTNILDRRFEKAGVFDLATKMKKKVYLRSVFLQGLILMDIEEILKKMAFVKPIIEKVESISKDLDLSRDEISLGYIKMEIPNANVVFGADTPDHVLKNIKFWGKIPPPDLVPIVKSCFDQIDETALNPNLWPN